MNIRPVTPTDDLQALLRTAKPGDEFILADGTYKGAYVSTRPGTEAAPVMFRAANPGKAIIVGNADGRQDGLSLYKCPWWLLDGVWAQEAARAGIYLGISSNVIVRACVSRMNGVQGLLAGNCMNVTVEDGEYYLNREQHGCYASGAVSGWKIRRNKLYCNGRAGAQYNAQGTTGFFSDSEITNNCMWGNGVELQAAQVNLLRSKRILVSGNSIRDGLAGGISMSDGSDDCTITNNSVTFRPGEGRSCIQATSGTHRATNNIVQVGKTNVQPINAVSPGVILESSNTVLPVATVSAGPEV